MRASATTSMLLLQPFGISGVTLLAYVLGLAAAYWIIPGIVGIVTRGHLAAGFSIGRVSRARTDAARRRWAESIRGWYALFDQAADEGLLQLDLAAISGEVFGQCRWDREQPVVGGEDVVAGRER